MRHLARILLLLVVTAASASWAQARYSQLNPGQTLWSNQSLWDPRGNYELRVQGDCNLVLYNRGVVRWKSDTNGWSSWCHADMQWDGNFVVYDAWGRVIWAANSVGASYLRLFSDGGLAVLRSDGKVYWGARGYISEVGLNPWTLISYQLGPNQTLYPGDVLMSPRSTDTRGYRLVMQSDCNLVLYSLQYYRGRSYLIDIWGTFKTYQQGQDIPIWATNTQWSWSGCHATFQGDGNLVVYDSLNRVRWASGTNGRATGGTLRMQDDGNLVIYNTWNQPVWASDTVNEVPPN